MGAKVVMGVVELVAGETVEVVQADFFVFLERDCLGKMMGVKLVIEVVV